MIYPKADSLDARELSNVYIRPSAGNELRVTEKGTTTTYLPVRASAFPTDSKVENKTNIEVWNDNMIDVLRNTKIYKYYRKNQPNYQRYGFIVGEGYNPPEQVLDHLGEGVEQYNMTSFCLKVCQELIHEVDKIKQIIRSDNNE